MADHQESWRSRNPQMSFCLPRRYYDMLFTVAEQQRYHGAAHLLRDLVVLTLKRVEQGLPFDEAWRRASEERLATATVPPPRDSAVAITPPGTIGPRSAPILENTDVYLDRSKLQLPQLPGIPAGTAHTLRTPDDDEPEDITAEASKLV